MKRKILIVEDNVSLSQRQKDWFEQAGYDAMTAVNEPAARALIRKHRFDLILSDVRLPEGDGISLLEWLKKEKRDIPFIITTEYVSVPDVVRTIKLGAKITFPSRYTGNTCWSWRKRYSVRSRLSARNRKTCSDVPALKYLRWRDTRG